MGERFGSAQRGLTPGELNELRAVVKRYHFTHYPQELCTDYEADKFIASLSDEVISNLRELGFKLELFESRTLIIPGR